MLLLCFKYCFYVILQVWRVSWNITGTVLSSSGDDGCVRLWKGILFNFPSLMRCCFKKYSKVHF